MVGLKRRPRRAAAQAPREVASAQRHHIRTVAALRDCLVLRDGRAVAVLEVAGRPVVALSESDQADVLANTLALFAGLQHPVQLLVRAEHVRLDEHADGVAQKTAGDPDLLPLGAAYAAFVRNLAGERRLIRRRCYTAVPSDPGTPWTAARRQLAARCDALAEGFSRLGMATRRLETAELVALEASIWNPGGAHAPWDYDRAPAQPGGADVLARSGLLDGVLSTLVPRRPPTKRERAKGWARHVLPGALRVRWLGEPPQAPGDREADAQEEELIAGAEGLADRLAPAAVRALADHVLLKGGTDEATRTLKLTAYPRVLALGWLTPLVTLDATVDLSMHVHPRETVRTLNGLGRRLTRLQGSLWTATKDGAIADPEVVTAVEDLTRLRDALSRGVERVFDVGVYLHLRAPSARGLGDAREGLQSRVEGAIRRLFAETRVAVYQQPDGFRAVLPEATDRVRATRQLDTSSLARSLPFVVATSTGVGILLGIDRRTSSPVFFDAHDPAAPNASIAVVAPAGSGKSYALKVLAVRHRFLGVEVLILDPEAEYRRLARAVGGQVVRFAVSRGSHVNPFDLPPVEYDEQTGEPSDPVDEQTAALGGLFEVMLATPETPLTAQQRAVLDRAVLAAYRGAGIEQGRPETWERPTPRLSDLHRELLGDVGPVAAGLAALLDRFVGGPYRGMFGPTDVRLDNPFTVFDVRDVPEDVRPVTTHMVTDFVWRRIRRERRPRLFIADEAATLLERPDSARFVGNFARRCRKYYTGLCIAVQDVAHLQQSREGLDVLANAGAKLVLGHRAERVDGAVAAFQLSPTDRQELLAAGKGEGLFIARGDRLSIKVLASAAEHPLVTTRPDEVAALEAAERAAADAAPRPEGADGAGADR